MKYTCIILLALIFCCCETPDKTPINKNAGPSEKELEISTSEIDFGFNAKSTSKLSFSKGRKDKIEELWKEILENNEDLNNDINFISEKLEILNEEIQVIDSQISNHADYFATIESKAKHGVKDSVHQKSLLAAIDKSRTDLKSKIDVLKERKLAAISIRDKFREHLIILKVSSVNSLVHRYFKEELGDGNELMKQTEEAREVVNDFTKRHPATY